MNLDLTASQALFNLGRELPEPLIIFFATYLLWLMYAGLFACGYFFYKKKAGYFLLYSLIASLFAKALNSVIGFIHFRPRPFLSLDFLPLINPEFLGKSFPSDHAAITWAIAVFVFFHNKKIGLIFILAAFLASISRVLAGVHYLSDIVVGAFIGAVVALLLARITFLPYKRRSIRGDKPKR